MSKGNLFFSKARGKLGNVVLSVLNGQQVARAHNETNSSKGIGASDTQREQRLHMLNLINLYRVLKRSEILAFSNKNVRNSDYNAFFKANLATAGVYLTKADFDRGACVAAPVVVAQGSLSPCVALVGSVSLGVASADFNWQSSATMGEYWQALINQNVGFQEGDMITIVKVAQKADVTISVTYEQYVVNPNDVTEASFALKEKFQAMEAGAEIDILITDANVDSAACVHTRKTGAKVEASFAKLSTPTNAIYTEYTSMAQRAKARDSYGYKSLPMLDPDSKVGGTEDSSQGSGSGSSGNRQYTITLTSANINQGTVSGGGTYTEGSRVNITATPKLGYTFDKWSDNNTQPSRSIQVTQNLTLIASFKLGEQGENNGNEGGVDAPNEFS